MRNTASTANFRMAKLSLPTVESMNRLSQPWTGCVPQNIVEDDLERPGIKQIGDAFAECRKQAQGKSQIVRPQEVR